MTTVKLKILKVPPEIHAELVKIADAEGRKLQFLAGQLLSEAIKTRKEHSESTPSGAAA